MNELTCDTWTFCSDDRAGQTFVSVQHATAGFIIGPVDAGSGFLEEENGFTVRPKSGEDAGTVSLISRGANELGIIVEVDGGSGGSIVEHLPFVPHLGELVRLSTGDAIPLGEQPFAWTVPGQVGAVEHDGWRLLLPGGTRIEWPVLPEDGTTIGLARLVVVMPFPKGRDKYEMVLQIV